MPLIGLGVDSLAGLLLYETSVVQRGEAPVNFSFPEQRSTRTGIDPSRRHISGSAAPLLARCILRTADGVGSAPVRTVEVNATADVIASLEGGLSFHVACRPPNPRASVARTFSAHSDSTSADVSS